MSYTKDPVYGNHLGIVINKEDPEYRGRVQVWIPYMSNTLHTDWNAELKDKKFKHIHDSGALTPALIEELKKVLPWAECASPIMGGGTAAKYNSYTGQTDTYPARTFSGPINSASPLSDPTLNGLKDRAKELVDEGNRLRGANETERELNFSDDSWGGRCFTAGTAWSAAMLDYKPLAYNKTGADGGATAASVATGENRTFQKSGFYNEPFTPVSGIYKPQIGDQMVMEGGKPNKNSGLKYGHNVTCIDDGSISGEVKWASDNTGREDGNDYISGGRKTTGEYPYYNTKVLRLNDEGLKRVQTTLNLRNDVLTQRPVDTAEIPGTSINPSKTATDITRGSESFDANEITDNSKHPGAKGIEQKNVVDKNQLYTNILNQLNNKLGDTPIPSDISEYGLPATKEGLATLMVKVAEKESSFDANTLGDDPYSKWTPTKNASMTSGKETPGSHGLFQLSPQDAQTYNYLGFKGNSNDFVGDTNVRSFSVNQLLDPNFNTDLTTSIFADTIKKTGKVRNDTLKSYGWLRDTDTAKINSKSGDVSIGSNSPMSIGSNSPMVSPIPNFNPATYPSNLSGAQPSGFVSIPDAGAKVFVFFLGGDIQRPVYFAGLLETESYRKVVQSSSPEAKQNEGPKQATTTSGLSHNGNNINFYSSINNEVSTLPPISQNNISINNPEGTRIDLNSGNSVYATPNDSTIHVGGTQTSSGFAQNITFNTIQTSAIEETKRIGFSDEKQNNAMFKAHEQLQKIVNDIQKKKVEEIKQKSKKGEKVPCPLCSTSHAVDRASSAAKKVKTLLRKIKLPYFSYAVDTLAFLAELIMIPFCSIVPGSALGECGNSDCEKGMIPSPQKPIEEANKNAAKALVSKQKEIANLEQQLGNGGSYTVVATKDIVISAGLPSGDNNDAPCYVETVNNSITVGLKASKDKQTLIPRSADNCKNVVCCPSIQAPGGNIILRGGNAVKIIAGSPGIELLTKGKLTLNCGSLEILTSDGQMTLGSNNHTVIKGKVVTIDADDRSGEGGVEIKAPHMSCKGLSVSGDAGIKGGLRIDGELSVAYINGVAQRMSTDDAMPPDQSGKFSNWAVGAAQTNDIANSIRLAITHYGMKDAMLLLSNIIKYVQESYNTILVNTVVETNTTGFGVGYGYVQVYNWHHNHMKEPEPHNHDYIIQRGTLADGKDAVYSAAVEPNPVPTRARQKGMGPDGGPKSLAGCGGFGGWGGGSYKGRRSKYNKLNSFGLYDKVKGFSGTKLQDNNVTYKYNKDGSIEFNIDEKPCD